MSTNNDNNHIQPNSSSVEESEIINSVDDVDRDNCIADHISSSLDETPGNYDYF